MKSSEMKPGTALRHTSGHIVILDRRKSDDDDLHGLPFHPGWWLRDDAGGLVDWTIDAEDSDWTVLGAVAVTQKGKTQ